MRIGAGALVAILIMGACGGTVSAPAPAVAVPVATVAPVASVKIADNAKLGKILVTASGATLYTFKRDTENTSACVDACLNTWPPFVLVGDAAVPATGMTGKLSFFTRKDNSAKQVTHNGLPLYNYAQDKVTGDANGEGVGANWFTVKNP